MFEWVYKRTSTGASSAAAAATGATDAEGMAISWMFNRDCYFNHSRKSASTLRQILLRTFSAETKSAACSNVSPGMSSTIRPILGSRFAGGDGGGGEPAAEVATAASAAKHRTLREHEDRLRW